MAFRELIYICFIHRVNWEKPWSKTSFPILLINPLLGSTIHYYPYQLVIPVLNLPEERMLSNGNTLFPLVLFLVFPPFSYTHSIAFSVFTVVTSYCASCWSASQKESLRKHWVLTNCKINGFSICVLFLFFL